MELVLATGNPHKATEFRRLFPGTTILVPQDLGVPFAYEETAETFLENALGKARALYQRLRRPVIADDSGLCVDALDGAPGVFSARFGATAGGNLESAQRNRLLLTRLQGVENRTARFVCCLVVVVDEFRFWVAQETLEGRIAGHPSGDGGFGYDPVFLVPEEGKTVAELPAATKDRISHRGRAAVRLGPILATMAGDGAPRNGSGRGPS